MVEPPLHDGADQLRTTWEFSAVALRLNGAEGTQTVLAFDNARSPAEPATAATPPVKVSALIFANAPRDDEDMIMAIIEKAVNKSIHFLFIPSYISFMFGVPYRYYAFLSAPGHQRALYYACDQSMLCNLFFHVSSRCTLMAWQGPFPVFAEVVVDAITPRNSLFRAFSKAIGAIRVLLPIIKPIAPFDKGLLMIQYILPFQGRVSL